MKRIKLFEDFNNKPLYQAETLLNNIQKNIKTWFSNGSLSKQGLSLLKMDHSFTNDVADKTLIFNFDDNSVEYQVIIRIGIEDLYKNDELQNDELEKKIENIALKIKKYDKTGQAENNYQGLLMDFWEGDIGVNELTEDFIIEKISQMEDTSLSDTNTSLNTEEIEETGEF